MIYPIEKAVADGLLNDVGQYLVRTGMLSILAHGATNPEVWIYRSKNGDIGHTFDDKIARNFTVIGHARVPRGCLNGKGTAIEHWSKTKSIEFAMSLGLRRDAAEYVVEWNYEESEINPIHQQS